MPFVVTLAFKAWLKANNNIKLSSDAAVTRLTYEGITNMESLMDFDKKSIESLPKACKDRIPEITEDLVNGVEPEPMIPGANISSIAVRRLIVASNAAKYYSAIGRVPTTTNMRYTQVLTDFKVEWEAYEELRRSAPPIVPLIEDRHDDRKVIKWSPIFEDVLNRTYGSRGPLAYVVRKNSEVPPEAEDALEDLAYFGRSGCLHEELVARLPHAGPIFKHDNTSVFLLDLRTR